ncbi:MAG: heme ABC exporter ATP-binding protein CcmA [Chloroflexi bacterium]|jgi:heme ABC exporter ATP-binding subunit CcmA|nr:heme ABC exporter ATP-binding protein CcmA [Chloroflexota bacterium]
MPTKTVQHPLQIHIQGLMKRYHRQPVLNQLSFTIASGNFCLLVGDNGAGKTTLLRILAGLVRPSQGEITCCGSLPGVDTEIRRLIGYVGHKPMLYQDLTALENLCHYAELYQIHNTKVKVSQAIQSFGLTAHQDQPVRTLSRGMQQRLSLARATLHNPVILLLDEPYTGLDQQAARLLDETLQNWHSQDRIILLAAHRPQRLLSIASHVAWLKEGYISTHVPVAELSTTPSLRRYLQEVA